MPFMKLSRTRYRQSLIALPCLYVVGAVILGILAPEIDVRREGGSANVDTARDVLTAVATGMIAFTGFVVSGVLLVVQFAAGQYSPRLVLWFRRDPLIKHAIGTFLAAFVFSLVALRLLDEPGSEVSPDVTVGVALGLLVGSSILFLALLQRVTDRLRPRTLFGAVTREGVRAAREIYPRALGQEPAAESGEWATAEPQRLHHAGRPGVLTSFDRDALVALALDAGAVVEIVPAVGEYVGPRAELLRVHGGRIGEEGPARCLVVADERTIEQDPAFAIRMVVDTAIRALSPAVNDPTTAVHALDVLEVLVLELAGRDLDASVATDAAGGLRLVWRAPSWEDLLDLAFSEIRSYGAASAQVCRRLRAVLDDLLEGTPEPRHPGLDTQLARLRATVVRSFPEGSPERELAEAGDRTGLGLART